MVLVLDNGKLYDAGKEVRVQVGSDIFTLKHSMTFSTAEITGITKKYAIMFLSDHAMLR